MHNICIDNFLNSTLNYIKPIKQKSSPGLHIQPMSQENGHVRCPKNSPKPKHITAYFKFIMDKTPAFKLFVSRNTCISYVTKTNDP
jgi:hypothetical protein